MLHQLVVGRVEPDLIQTLAEAEILSQGVSAHALVTCGEALLRLGENIEARRYFQEARRIAADISQSRIGIQDCQR